MVFSDAAKKESIDSETYSTAVAESLIFFFVAASSNKRTTLWVYWIGCRLILPWNIPADSGWMSKKVINLSGIVRYFKSVVIISLNSFDSNSDAV